MKKLFLIFAAIAMLATFGTVQTVVGADANQMHYVTLYNPDVAVPGAGVPVDIAAYKGNASIVINWGQTTSAAHTSTVTIAHSATAGGTYATLTNIAGTVASFANYGLSTNTLTIYPIDLGRMKKYVKASVATTVDSETNKVGILFVAPFKAQ